MNFPSQKQKLLSTKLHRPQCMDCSGNFNFNFVSIPFGYAVVIIEPQIFYVEDGCVKSNYSDDEHLIEDHFSS